MLWFKKQLVTLTSTEYEMLVKRVATLESRFNSLEIENETLRNKVLRKIQFSRPKEEDDTPTSVFPKPQNINTISPFN